MSNGYNGCCNNLLARHLCKYIGESVTIFTTSGGVSGCGFTGVLLSVNSCYCRLVTEFGAPPSSPIAENICGDFDNQGCGCNCGCGGGNSGCGGGNSGRRKDDYYRRLGSVCDIPIENIAAFCHNAV